MRTFVLFATAIGACAAAILGVSAIQNGSCGLALINAFLVLVNAVMWSLNYWIVP